MVLFLDLILLWLYHILMHANVRLMSNSENAAVPPTACNTQQTKEKSPFNTITAKCHSSLFICAPIWMHSPPNRLCFQTLLCCKDRLTKRPTHKHNIQIGFDFFFLKVWVTYKESDFRDLDSSSASQDTPCLWSCSMCKMRPRIELMISRLPSCAYVKWWWFYKLHLSPCDRAPPGGMMLVW